MAAVSAQAGEISYRDRELVDLVGGADRSGTAVVVLKLATPATERKDWPVPGKGAKTCAPYQGWQWRGTVEQVIYAPRKAGVLRVGDGLVVAPADMLDLIELEHRACVEGVSKSPIWSRFAGVEPKAGQRVVAVLRWAGESAWLERVSGSWLDPKDLLKLRALLPPSRPFLPSDAVRATWARQPPAWPAAEVHSDDQWRLQEALARIGAPGAPALLPAELTAPTEAVWLAKAKQAHAPAERVTALMMLNRLKSKQSWSALTGLQARDAAAWPAELDPSWAVQKASELAPMPKELQPFIDALAHRFADSARVLAWRRALTGQPGGAIVKVSTRADMLKLSELWGRATGAEKARGAALCAAAKLDLAACALGQYANDADHALALQQLRHGLGEPQLPALLAVLARPAPWQAEWTALAQTTVLAALELLPTVAKSPAQQQEAAAALQHWLGKQNGLAQKPAWLQARALPVLRKLGELGKLASAAADGLRATLLTDPSPLVRAAGIEDLPAAPTDTHAIVARVARDREVDAAQALVAAAERWHLTPAQTQQLLTPLLKGDSWAVRLQAWQALSKLGPQQWPAAAPQHPGDQELLALADQLQTRAKPVRVLLTFASPQQAGKATRQVLLQLDPVAAPINVANLLLLVRKGFYNGRAVARVVPEFVVQLGSPIDTMDGGPGYHVPCENHLAPYLPGSVGMALSGKDTGGSQFFVTLGAAPHLTGQYTHLGTVEDLPKALAVLRDLAPGDVLVSAVER